MCFNHQTNWIMIVISYIFQLGLGCVGYNLKDKLLRWRQRPINMVFLFADRSSKQSSLFCVPSQQILFLLFYINTPLPSILFQLPFFFAQFSTTLIERIFLWYCTMKGIFLEILWSHLIHVKKLCSRVRCMFTWEQTYLSFQSIRWKVYLNFVFIFNKSLFSHSDEAYFTVSFLHFRFFIWIVQK